MTKQDKQTMKEIEKQFRESLKDKITETFMIYCKPDERPNFKTFEEANSWYRTHNYLAERIVGSWADNIWSFVQSNISTIRREAVGGITEQDMTDTIEAIDTIVNNDWGFDISLKLANKKEFTQEEAVQMGERIMDIYVLVHGFDTQCCKSSKAKLIQKLLSYKKVNNE